MNNTDLHQFARASHETAGFRFEGRRFGTNPPPAVPLPETVHRGSLWGDGRLISHDLPPSHNPPLPRSPFNGNRG